MNVKVKKLIKTAIIPAYARQGDAGLDFRSAKSIDILPGERALIPTGISIELPEGFEMQIRPRSGLALKHGITVLNSPGTIDSGYRGEIGIILFNASCNTYRVMEGEKIAQGVITTYCSANLVEVDELGESERGEGGFGHSDEQSVEPVQLDWIDDDSLRKAWREGTIAGERGFRKSDNPYSEGMEEAQQWEDARYRCDHSTTLRRGQ